MARPKNQLFYYKNNRLQQLRGFCYAAQSASISRAAEHMGLAASSVSLQIKALEEDLGYKLFHRNGPSISLTFEGEKLLQFALPMIDNIEQLPEIFRQKLAAGDAHHLRIAANGTVKTYLLPEILQQLIEADKNIRVSIYHVEHDEALSLIKDDQVDVAFLPRRTHRPFPKDYDYQPIFCCTPSLITPPKHPLAGKKNLTIDAINQYPLVLPAPDLQVIANLHETFSTPTQAPLRVNFMNSETGREYIEAGLFITVSSDIWIRAHDRLVATPLSHLFETVDYGIVTKRRAGQNASMKLFIETAHGIAGKRNQKAA